MNTEEKQADEEIFAWTGFYESIADKLLLYKDRREELIIEVNNIVKEFNLSGYEDRFPGRRRGPLMDICPFTTMGIFNRGKTANAGSLSEKNRIQKAQAMADFLKVEIPAPNSFNGIPLLNGYKSWFFDFAINRNPNDIDNLWRLFARAIDFANSNNDNTRLEFKKAYDEVIKQRQVGWALTAGLYWIRPWNFPVLLDNTRKYIKDNLDVKIGRNGPKGYCNADDYLNILNTLKERFEKKDYPVHSFPELSIAPYNTDNTQSSTSNLSYQQNSVDNPKVEEDTAINQPKLTSYSIDNIVKDGCFIAREEIESILQRLKDKKNLILQGPPGTGKTWLAKRLAYALIGQKSKEQVRAMQFHPNISYEDFVRGYRPGEDSRLELVDGPFMQMIDTAKNDIDTNYVIVIEEINRGNPAQIFGEMLTLLEAGKRDEDDALELSYGNERVYIPSNLYVIGTMNLADRSLALVDFALRRRFAFIDLEPAFGVLWQNWVNEQYDINEDLLNKIERRITELNEQISQDSTLGKQYRIGHSFVTPDGETPIANAQEWFRDIVKTEIAPLLAEYWYDAHGKVTDEIEKLLADF